MNSKKSLRKLLSRMTSSQAKRRVRRTKPNDLRVDQLETRTMLAVFPVLNNNSSGPDSLRAAIEGANALPGDDNITFAATTNGTNFLLAGNQFQITDFLTITGNGAANTVIDAQQLSRIFNFQAGDFTLNGVTLKNGKVDFSGGGAIASSSSGLLTIQNSTLSGNSTSGNASSGGAIFAANGAVTIIQSTLSGNSTTGSSARGGAIYANNSGTVTISQSTLSGNSTAGPSARGGAIFVANGAVTISHSTLSGNSTTGSSADGGAINAFFGVLTISQSTLSGNSTAGGSADGGAIYAYNAFSSAVTISQSTLSGNSTAGEGAGGGAIYASDGAVTISQSTLTLNNADQDFGGAIYSNTSSVTIRNSIVAGNTDSNGIGTAPDVRRSPDLDDTFTVTNSLIGRNNGTNLTATGNTPNPITGNLIGGNNPGTAIDPLLGPLSDNGGPTQTHALLINSPTNSPAIDRGSNVLAAGLTTDQRGNPFARIVETTVDMGAYERQTVAGLSLVVDTNQDENDGNYGFGDLSLRDAIGLANGSVGSNTITFAPSTNGTEFDLTLFEMFVTETLTITGNGAANTVIDAQQLSRIFNFQAGDFTLNGVTLKNGKVDFSGGGAIASSSSGLLTIQNSTLSGNSTTGSGARGGAIYANYSGAVTISQSTLSGNSTTGSSADGGAIFANSGAVTISQSTLSGNSTTGSFADGGAINAYSGAVTISQSTLSGNSTTGSSADGGAIFAFSSAVTISQSTLSGNSTAGEGAGGGAIYASDGAVTISQSTLTLNNADQDFGGAIYSNTSSVTIRNSIVAGNTDSNGIGTAPDVRRSPDLDDTFTVTNSLIGRNNGTNLTATGNTPNPITGNLIGGNNPGTAIDPLLGPLSDNGGPTQTHALLINSPTNSPAIDRGSNVLAAGLTTDQRGNPFARIVETTVDMGAYERQTVAGLSLVVDTNQDENDGNYGFGDLSLRDAIGLANGSVGSNTITFAPSTNGTEFDLTLFEMFVTETLTITGNGAANTVIDAQQLSRIFNFQAGDFTLIGVTLKNGKVAADFSRGGAIASSSSGLLTIQNSTLSGNSTSGSNGSSGLGGAIYTDSGAVSISQSTLSGNSTAVGTFGYGGAIFAFSGAVTISQSTLSGNRVLGPGGGGAIFFDDGDVTITNSTLTGNSANIGGAIGIVDDDLGESLTIRNSIIAGNTAATNPDFTAPGNPGTNLVIQNSLIGRNNGTGLTATGNDPDANGNLIGGNSDTLKIDPKLAPLANNGGPTQTHALLINSPAFNRGSNALAAGLTTDQRGSGFSRTRFGIVDMGALESGVLDSPEGTAGNDTVELFYFGSSANDAVLITRSTDGGPVFNLGSFPITSPLVIDAMGGTDIVRVFGSTSADAYFVSSAFIFANGSTLTLTNFETRVLNGRAGNDLYRFDADEALGTWIMNESGGGTDTIDFGSTTFFGVNLNLGLATTQVVNSNLSLFLGSGSTFENAEGGLGADRLTGNSLANSLTGGLGNDILLGGLGDDTYIFGAPTATEADQVEEFLNQGTDTLSFASLPFNVALNLGTAAVQPVHTGRTLKLNSNTNFENAVGGAGADTLTGNAFANRLTGGAGNDILNGMGGNDVLLGGLNDDTYVFGVPTAAEVDQVEEIINQGTDTLTFAALTSSVILNLGTVAVQPVHTFRTLKLNSNSNFENAIGGLGADTLTGNSVGNRLTGGAGNDILNGMGGNDVLLGGLNDDTYVFGIPTAAEADQVEEFLNQGTDTLSFTALTSSVTLNLGTVLVQPVHSNRTLKLNSNTNFENAIGGSGADTLTGNSLANVLTGGTGNDTLNGLGGNDNLFGGLNDDTYVFGVPTASEVDQIEEYLNQGTDTVSFAALTSGVALNLGTALVQPVHTNRTLKLNSNSNFENAVGGSAADTLTGNSANNRLTGGNGNNILVGLDGNDILEAGTGRDLLIGGLGLDTLNGGSGDDILIAGRTTSDTNTTSLNTIRTEWASANPYATRIANLRAGVGNPVVSLQAGVNVLNDAGEDDQLTGGLGSDWYFRAVDDVISDFSVGEIIDLL